MSGPANAPTPPRRSAGISGRMTLAIIVVAALVAVLVFSWYERRAAQSDTHAGLLERGMSPGHRMLNREAGRTLPSNAPRIQRADALITRVASRYRLSKDKVADLALTTRGMIADRQTEDVLDVLDAALFATEGMPPGRLPPLPPVFAAYAKARMDGASVAAARNVARSFVQVTVNNAENATPPR